MRQFHISQLPKDIQKKLCKENSIPKKPKKKKPKLFNAKEAHEEIKKILQET